MNTELGNAMESTEHVEHEFEESHTGAHCQRLIVNADGFGDLCAQPPSSPVHWPSWWVVSCNRADVIRAEHDVVILSALGVPSESSIIWVDAARGTAILRDSVTTDSLVEHCSHRAPGVQV